MTTMETVIASPVLKIRMEGVDAMAEEGEVTGSF